MGVGRTLENMGALRRISLAFSPRRLGLGGCHRGDFCAPLCSCRCGRGCIPRQPPAAVPSAEGARPVGRTRASTGWAAQKKKRAFRHWQGGSVRLNDEAAKCRQDPGPASGPGLPSVPAGGLGATGPRRWHVARRRVQVQRESSCSTVWQAEEAARQCQWPLARYRLRVVQPHLPVPVHPSFITGAT